MSGSHKHIVVFASGTGSNFTCIQEWILEHRIPAEIVLLISNNPKCRAIDTARAHEIETAVVNAYRFPDYTQMVDKYLQILADKQPDLIVLAGYMKLIPVEVVRSYNRRIMNIHPALLPAFGGRGYYGMNVHRAVLASGAKVTGPTVHFIDEEYDRGPILAQRTLEISAEDTAESIAARVLELEHQLFPEVVKAFCEDRIFWQNDVPFIGNSF